MAYVSPTAPLPRNSQDPLTQCEVERAATIVNTVEQLVANAKAASAQTAGPNSFRQFGPGVVIDVARSQNAAVAASHVASSPAVAVAAVPSYAAPEMLPLNATPAEFNGCAARGNDILQAVPTRPQVLTMPPRMPARVAVPSAAVAPKYSNLCWALRNAAVDVSQFDPAELEKLQLACMQKGYAGACFPPPLVALWLDQQRRAGTLPHITVDAGTLAMIPPAPPLTGVDCSDSWKLAGMAGYMPTSRFPKFRYRRGMGATWGSAASVSCDGAPGASSSGVSAVTPMAWGLLAIGAGLLYALGHR
jgi:hypothetical protein